MRIDVKDPEFRKQIKDGSLRATRKGVTHKIESDDNMVIVTVLSGDRKLGIYGFRKEDDTLVQNKSFTIERDYNPFEYALTSLTNYAKRRKIKYITYG